MLLVHPGVVFVLKLVIQVWLSRYFEFHQGIVYTRA